MELTAVTADTTVAGSRSTEAGTTIITGRVVRSYRRHGHGLQLLRVRFPGFPALPEPDLAADTTLCLEEEGPIGWT